MVCKDNTSSTENALSTVLSERITEHKNHPFYQKSNIVGSLYNLLQTNQKRYLVNPQNSHFTRLKHFIRKVAAC